MLKRVISALFFLCMIMSPVTSQIQYEGYFQFNITISSIDHTHFYIIVTYLPPSSGWDHSYESIGKSYGVENFKAYDYLTKKSLKVMASERDIYIDYKIEFGKKITSKYVFVMEFDASNAVKKEGSDEYNIKWGWGHFDSKILQSYSVILPPNFEIIKTEFTSPKEVTRTGNRLTLLYEGESLKGDYFTWRIYFSNKGFLYLQQAQKYISTNDFSNAENYFELSKTFYERAGNSNRVTEIEGQLELIRGKASKISEANTFFVKGETYFTSNDYENAILYYQKAKLVYDELKENSKSELADRMIKKVNDTIRNEADVLFEEGKGELNNGNYEVAYQKFYNAREKFLFLKDDTRISECDSWISRVSKTRESEKNKKNIIIYASIGIVSIILIIIFSKTTLIKGLFSKIIYYRKTDVETSKAAQKEKMPFRFPENIVIFSGYAFLLLGFLLLGILETISLILGIFLFINGSEKNRIHALIISYNSFVVFIFYLVGVMGWF
jgi:tetratricopeptide (TPR) repeat protein